jgi:hypothetical protein
MAVGRNQNCSRIFRTRRFLAGNRSEKAYGEEGRGKTGHIGSHNLGNIDMIRIHKYRKIK